ncbi:MAG: hypothetical protein ACXAB4_06810 [Candidatus Hodarchaeales archaeon]
MSYDSMMNDLMAQGYFHICVILDPQGNIYWTNNPEWQVDGPTLLAEWQKSQPSYVVGGTKFSAIVRTEDTLVAKNLPQQGGTLILKRAPNGYYFLTWTSGETQIPPTNIQAEVSRMALLFR